MDVTIDRIARVAAVGATGLAGVGLLARMVDWARRIQHGVTVIEEPVPPAPTPLTVHVAPRHSALFPSQERAGWAALTVSLVDQCSLVDDHYRCAYELLLASDYARKTEGEQRSIAEGAALQVRKGVETGVDCVLDLAGVCHQGMDLCNRLRECVDYLPCGMFSQLHEARKVCNICIHGHPDPGLVYEELLDALDILRDLSAYLQRCLRDSPLSAS
ncbi:hypothetical protein [Bifidobacterium cuniculi]|uniref:Uncharacterized protein n=1 Tax=Bifidobacterium cuniculi TaxID=1688 RepID=A0A087ADJ1_9BIFI|nr:hypothetical protein [Bifidobacterium cuniculi]KFI56841.1 hypothetical protein BCUN_2163 [Bifidobacterium cuniculi]